MNKNVFIGLLVVILVFFIIRCGDEIETTYSVTFNSNGGSNVQNIIGIKSGTTITFPENPIKEGQTFDGWFIDNETFHNEFTSSTIITSDLTVFAKWLPYIVPVEFIGTWKSIYTKLYETSYWVIDHKNIIVSFIGGQLDGRGFIGTIIETKAIDYESKGFEDYFFDYSDWFNNFEKINYPNGYAFTVSINDFTEENNWGYNLGQLITFGTFIHKNRDSIIPDDTWLIYYKQN